MIRLHSTKLLSGVSAVAVMASLGAAGPAHAAQAFTGPGLFAPYVNSQIDAITVTNHAVMNSDGVINPESGNSITNSIAMSGAGDKILIDDSVLAGGILNTNTGSIVSSTADGIDITDFAVIVGTINNAGLIQGGTNGVEINQSTVVGGLFNDVGAAISGASNGILITNDTVFIGGISNEGAITGTSGDGIRMTGANVDFIGGITNFASGTITSNGTTNAAIDIGFPAATSSFIGDINNSGTIQGLGGGTGIFVNTGAFVGNIVNNSGGLIQGTGTSAIAINIAGGAFSGNIDNSGQILSTGTSGIAIQIGGTAVFAGDVTNNEGGLIQAAHTALAISSTSFTGNVLNQGAIVSNSGTAIAISTASFAGNLTNDRTGTITGSALGVSISSTGFVGDVSNLGLIQGNEGLRVETGAAITGAIDNSGTIIGNTGDAVHIKGTISGVVSNEGLIQGSAAGIAVQSTVGGITNSGTIIGTQAIDLQLATGATTITQTAGSMQGDLRLDQSGAEFNDTFNANGGELRGDIIGGGGDNMAVAGDFAYVSGTASGLDQVDINSGTAVFGSTAFGVDGVGVLFASANDMTIAGGATAYLDDNTTIGLNNNLNVNSGGTLAYYVTSDTTTHGQVNAVAGVNLDGTLLAVVNGSSFASVGGNTFTYANIITGPVSGTFANVDTTSLFFDGQAIYHANAVDLELDRLGFNDVLTLGGLTHNQQSVGGALETIYSGGAFGSDFTDLFNYLLSLPVGSQGQVTAIYDELGGAEHAQVQQATLRASQPFDDAIDERLDDAKWSLRGSRWADADPRRYADAAQQSVMTDAASAPAGSQGILRGSSGISIWGRGYGDWTDVSGDAEAPGYNQDAGGAAGGLDVAVGENAVVGGALGWSTSSVDFKTPVDHANIDSFQFGGYGSYGFGRFYADTQVSFAFHDVTTTRELDLGYRTFVGDANYNARTWTVAGEIGTIFKVGSVNLQPMVGVNYTGASTDSFIETGAGDFSLIVADANTDSFTSKVGMRASGVWTVGGMKLVPDASVAWRHEFADGRQSFTAAFLDDPATLFNIISSKISPDSAVVNAGITAGVTRGLELFVDYDGIINSDASSNSGSAGFRATW